MQVLKVGMPDVGFQPFALHGEAQGCKFPPDRGSPHGGVGFMARLSFNVSDSFQCVFKKIICLFMYLFIFGCIGSSLLCVGFL